MKCAACGKVAIGGEELCLDCKIENNNYQEQLDALEVNGHPHHCAVRIVMGDGVCECGIDKTVVYEVKDIVVKILHDPEKDPLAAIREKVPVGWKLIRLIDRKEDFETNGLICRIRIGELPKEINRNKKMIKKLVESYSDETRTFICPVCNKNNIRNIFIHCSRKLDDAHNSFLEKFNSEINNIIDPLFPTHMQIEINTEIQRVLPCFTPVSIANKIRTRSKELGINPRKVLGKNREGLNNVVHLPGVKEKISKSIQELWEDGSYDSRINGMLGKIGPLNPQYDPTIHTIKNRGEKHFNSFLSNFQDIKKCARCGSSDKKINVHHIDEDHCNFLPSNLEPLCVPCHMSNHYPQDKRPFAIIGRDFTFAAAHQLPNHTGLCRYLHGHEWKLRVEIKKRIDFKTGMVLDFSKLKKVVNEIVIEHLDHSTLNESLYTPTAENLLIWIWERLMFDGLLKGIFRITIWESPNSSAMINVQSMLSVFGEKNKNISY